MHDNFFSADPTVLPSVAEPEPGIEGAVIKLTPGAVITNYGSAPALAPQHWSPLPDQVPEGIECLLKYLLEDIATSSVDTFLEGLPP